MKQLLKKHSPSVYKWLCRIKDTIKPPRRTWGKYYDGEREGLQVPEKFLLDLKLPPHIDTILNLGCGAGRDFIPFDGTLKLWGLDIVPFERIKWVRPFKNLTYTHQYIEDFTKDLERGKYDLTHTFIYACGTLMYVSKEDSERFFAACKKAGATIFLFREFPKGSYAPDQDFKLDPALFTVIPDYCESHSALYISGDIIRV